MSGGAGLRKAGRPPAPPTPTPVEGLGHCAPGSGRSLRRGFPRKRVLPARIPLAEPSTVPVLRAGARSVVRGELDGRQALSLVVQTPEAGRYPAPPPGPPPDSRGGELPRQSL